MTNRELRDKIDVLRQELRVLRKQVDNRIIKEHIHAAGELLYFAWGHLDRMLERQERKGTPPESEVKS